MAQLFATCVVIACSRGPQREHVSDKSRECLRTESHTISGVGGTRPDGMRYADTVCGFTRRSVGAGTEWPAATTNTQPTLPGQSRQKSKPMKTYPALNGLAGQKRTALLTESVPAGARTLMHPGKPMKQSQTGAQQRGKTRPT